MRSTEKNQFLWKYDFDDECIRNDYSCNYNYDCDNDCEGFLPLDDTLHSKASVRLAGRLSSHHPVSAV